MGIAQDLPEVIALYPNAVTARVSNHKKVTVFRTGPTHARRINRFQVHLDDISRFLDKQIHDRQQAKYERLAKLYGLRNAYRLVAGATETIVYPDPDPEITSHDGQSARTGANATFDVLHDATGNTNRDSIDSDFVQIRASATIDQYERITRLQFLFDVSSITDSDTLDDATLSVWIVGKINSLLGEGSLNSALVVCEAVPGSDTASADSDFQAMLSTDFGRTGTQASITTGEYTDIILNALGEAEVDFTDLARYGLRDGWDIDDLIPHDTGATWGSTDQMSMEMRMADRGGSPSTINDPKLTLNTTEAPVGANVPPYGQVIFNSADEESRPRYGQRIARGTEE